MKTGIVFEGGAFRTIFSCGVMDAFLDRDIMPDYMIGVSAGAAYGVSYASRQKRRNLQILLDYRDDKRYMSMHNMTDKTNRSVYGLDLPMTRFRINWFRLTTIPLMRGAANFTQSLPMF